MQGVILVICVFLLEINSFHISAVVGSMYSPPYISSGICSLHISAVVGPYPRRPPYVFSEICALHMYLQLWDHISLHISVSSVLCTYLQLWDHIPHHISCEICSLHISAVVGSKYSPPYISCDICSLHISAVLEPPPKKKKISRRAVVPFFRDIIFVHPSFPASK